MTEYIGLDELLLIAEAVLGIPAHDLYRTCDIAAANAVLGAAEAVSGAGGAPASLAEQAAVLTHRLCVTKPLPLGNEPVAYVLLREFIDRNAGTWVAPAGDHPNADETVKVLWETSSGQLSLRDLTTWLDERIGAHRVESDDEASM